MLHRVKIRRNRRKHPSPRMVVKRKLLPISTQDPKDEKATTDEEGEKKSEEPKEEPFELKDLKMDVPKGAFVAIVGRVGSGKVRFLYLSRSILLLMLISECLLEFGATSPYR